MYNNNLFDSTSLFAEFTFSYAAFESASEHVIEGKLSRELTQKELFGLLEMVCTVEHEYFHCRHLASTSFGYLFFFLHQRLTVSRLLLFKSLPFPEFIAPFAQGGAGLQAFLTKRKLYDALGHLAAIYKDMMFLDCLFRYSSAAARDLAMARSDEDGYVLDESSDAVIGVGPFLRNIHPSDIELLGEDDGLSLNELVEGFAIWKEYAYISRILWNRFRRHFGELTRTWVASWRGMPRYRQVGDVIMEHTGCNLSMALPGVILDLAFQGSFFGMADKTWDSVHPILRLRHMLKVAQELPLSIRRVDNCVPVDKSYYDEVEAFFCHKLGWPSSREAVNETLTMMRSRQKFAARQMTGRFGDVLGSFYDRHFAIALSGRFMAASTYVFPWTNKHREFLGHATAPIVSFFDDRVVINSREKDDVGLMLYFDDIVVTAFFDAFFDQSFLEGPAQALHRRARLLYERTRDVLRERYPELNRQDQSYEDFLSERFGWDYSEFQRIRRQKP